MLVREAKWFRDRLRELSSEEMFPLLNVGCQSEDFRKKGQPWVDEYVFQPLRAAGKNVVHTDVWHAPGVDLVGDLLDPHFRSQIRSQGFRSVMFSNVLEHVEQPQALAAAVADCVPPGGLIFVSAPYRFPYHPDPIDTMFRPDLETMTKLFPHTKLERGEILRCGNLTTYLLSRIFPNPFAFMSRMAQGSGPAPEGNQVQRPTVATMLPWLIQSFQISCAVLRRSP